MRKAWVLCAAVVAACELSGCAVPMKDLSGAFRESDFSWANAPGTARIVGQAFARTNAGDVKSCAGLPVYLAPATRYTDAINDAMNDGYTRFTQHPREYEKYIRRTVADVVGGFEFAGLPAGAWYVECDLSYMISANGYGGTWTGARVSRRVTVAEGAVEKVMVTPTTVTQSNGLPPPPHKPLFKPPNTGDCRIWC